MSIPAVELRRVTKTYREGESERVVFRDADLAIRPGEVAALLGRSGSGKSTLLNLISGIDLPSAGGVHVEGTDLTRLAERERTLLRRRRIGFVFQSFNLLPVLTVLENLLLPLELAGRSGPAGRARAVELLARVGLADRAASFPDRLSGGEQQRLAVARAVVHAPALVLADEPTGNLDTEATNRVLDLLQDLVRTAGVTLVVATHSREIAGLADRVFTLEGGRLVAAPGGPR